MKGRKHRDNRQIINLVAEEAEASGIQLFNQLDQVLRKLGEPISKKSGPHSMRVYHFERATVELHRDKYCLGRIVGLRLYAEERDSVRIVRALTQSNRDLILKRVLDWPPKMTELSIDRLIVPHPRSTPADSVDAWACIARFPSGEVRFGPKERELKNKETSRNPADLYLISGLAAAYGLLAARKRIPSFTCLPFEIAYDVVSRLQLLRDLDNADWRLRFKCSSYRVLKNLWQDPSRSSWSDGGRLTVYDLSKQSQIRDNDVIAYTKAVFSNEDLGRDAGGEALRFGTPNIVLQCGQMEPRHVSDFADELVPLLGIETLEEKCRAFFAAKPARDKSGDFSELGLVDLAKDWRDLRDSDQLRDLLNASGKGDQWYIECINPQGFMTKWGQQIEDAMARGVAIHWAYLDFKNLDLKASTRSDPWGLFYADGMSRYGETIGERVNAVVTSTDYNLGELRNLAYKVDQSGHPAHQDILPSTYPHPHILFLCLQGPTGASGWGLVSPYIPFLPPRTHNFGMLFKNPGLLFDKYRHGTLEYFKLLEETRKNSAPPGPS